MAQPTPAAQFAANVRRQRERRGLTKEQAAWACGLHPSAFGRIEAGERKPTLETIFRLAAGLEVPPAELFAGID
ncbi:MAG: helix-turn-helix domain-containing protein [Solirubrobacterales bacterium]